MRIYIDIFEITGGLKDLKAINFHTPIGQFYNREQDLRTGTNVGEKYRSAGLRSAVRRAGGSINAEEYSGPETVHH